MDIKKGVGNQMSNFHKLFEIVGVDIRNFVVDYYSQDGQACHKGVQVFDKEGYSDKEVIDQIKEAFRQRSHKVYSIVELAGQLTPQDIEAVAVGKKKAIAYRLVYIDKKQMEKRV